LIIYQPVYFFLAAHDQVDCLKLTEDLFALGDGHVKSDELYVVELHRLGQFFLADLVVQIAGDELVDLFESVFD
jgi:hypothetical protein